VLKLAIKNNWDQDIIGKLESVKRKIQKQILLKAVKKVAKDLSTAIKAVAPNKYGTLRQSIGIKAYNKRSKVASVGIIGARMNWSLQVGKTLHTPWRYISPLSKGHRLHNSNVFVVGNDFIERVFRARQSSINTSLTANILAEYRSAMARKG
jgi:hypothetical protein